MQNYSDIFVIGGGINGTAIAADAAGRGLSVTLCEKNDLASGTSSTSSKLIHGGLRYLEFYDFGLVKEALHEREVMLFRAPHLVSPLEFVLPHEKHLRPTWLIKIGLLLYDYLAKRAVLPKSKTLQLQKDIRGQQLLPHLKKGFSYFDCFTDDSRLVILNALSAKNNHALVLTRMEFLSAERQKDRWEIHLKNIITGENSLYYSKVLINVTGPWVKENHKKIKGSNINFNVRLDKGSHIVVSKLYEGNFAYILQNSDNRIIFAIPYLDKYTLIGTTDIEYSDVLDNVTISEAEETYLCQIVNQYFKIKVTKKDIIWSFAGVRCLKTETLTHNSVANVSRDYKCLSEEKNKLLLMTIIGGKLTTHRILAEDVVNQLHSYFPHAKPAWTSKIPLPGGDLPDQNFGLFFNQFKKDFPWLPVHIAYRYAKNYGTRSYLILNNAFSLNDLGTNYSHGLYQKELNYLMKEEWAKHVEDILWRRTKLGLFFSENEIENLTLAIQNSK